MLFATAPTRRRLILAQPSSARFLLLVPCYATFQRYFSILCIFFLFPGEYYDATPGRRSLRYVRRGAKTLAEVRAGEYRME